MKWIPIQMRAPMVRAILARQKTQTRRLKGLDEVNKDPDAYILKDFMLNREGKWVAEFIHREKEFGGLVIACPFGAAGDFLWVKETWALHHENPFKVSGYKASNSDKVTTRTSERKADGSPRWRSSMFMPKWASRIALLRTANRAPERLQDISDEDAKAEGITVDSLEKWMTGDDTPRGMFGEFWESIHGPEAWEKNPWLWPVEFSYVPNPPKEGSKNGQAQERHQAPEEIRRQNQERWKS